MGGDAVNGVGLPLHSPPPLAAPLLPRSPLLKRLANRLRTSAQTASPPPRLLLVVLLAAQILVLAIIRLGPFAIPPVPTRHSPPLFFETNSRSPLKFLHAESKDPLSLPVQKTLPSLRQEGNAVALQVSVADDDLPVEVSSSSDEDESHPEIDTRAANVSPFTDKKRTSNRLEHPLSKKSEHKISGEASLTSEGKSSKQTAELEAIDELLPSVVETTAVSDNRDASRTTERTSNEEVVKRKTTDDVLPSVDSFRIEELGINNDELPIAEENSSSQKKSRHRTTRASKGDDLLLPSVEDSFLSDAQRGDKTATATALDRSSVVDIALSGQDEGLSIANKGTAHKSTLLKGISDLSKEKSAVTEELTAGKATGQVASSTVGERLNSELSSSNNRKAEQKATPAKEDIAEVTTLHVKRESKPEKHSSVDPKAEKLQNDEVVSANASKEKPVIAEKVNPMVSSECKLGYIYIYDLPAEFNHDVVSNCSALNPWLNVCSTLANGGLGESLGDKSPLGQTGSWFISDQFTAEVVFHNRMLQHPCLTDKPELASGFYVPYYAGLDVGRYLWAEYPAERRDRVSKHLLKWLDGQEYWKRSGGWNHFMMIGRITWDFRRSKDEDWGSGFFYNPPMVNTTRLLIERNPWDEQEMAVPYPTNFHPQSDADLRAWQDHLRRLKKSFLFSFAGAPRSTIPNDFRAILLSQCEQSQSCQSLDCSNLSCGTGQQTLELFLNSTFCLQPRGDSFTRRSTFDCLLAGSIPVFFWRRSAYFQYKWHLPSDDEVGSYSVFISKEDMRNGTNIEQVLKSLSPEKVRAMQEAVINMIPKIVYAVSGFSLKDEKDAFDVAIDGVLRRYKQLNPYGSSKEL